THCRRINSSRSRAEMPEERFRMYGSRQETTYNDGRVLIRTRQGSDSRLLQNNPTDSILLAQTIEVGGGELLPIFLRLQLREPLVCQRRKHGYGTAIFADVSQAAALCRATEPYRFLSGNTFIERIDREHGTLR